MITLIGGEKGGSGKTTIATNLAAWLAGEGRDVMLLDADHNGASKAWTEWRNEAGITPVVHCVQASGDISRPARDLAGRFGELVVDAAGHDSKELRSALVAADVLIVPMRPTAFDMLPLVHMDELVSAAKIMNPNLRAYLLYTQVPTGAMNRDVLRTEEHLAGMQLAELKLLPLRIRNLQAYRDVVIDGKSVVERAGDARAEIQLLGQFIYNNDNTETQQEMKHD